MSIAMFDYQRITFRYEVEIGLHEFAWRVRSDFCVFLNSTGECLRFVVIIIVPAWGVQHSTCRVVAMCLHSPLRIPWQLSPSNHQNGNGCDSEDI